MIYDLFLGFYSFVTKEIEDFCLSTKPLHCPRCRQMLDSKLVSQRTPRIWPSLADFVEKRGAAAPLRLKRTSKSWIFGHGGRVALEEWAMVIVGASAFDTATRSTVKHRNRR
jgi:hypothetical protein